jgi:hypothetical protein
MGNQNRTKGIDSDAIAADYAQTGNVAETARNFGLSRSTVHYHLDKQPPKTDPKEVAPIPELLTESEEPITKTIERLTTQSERRHQLKKARKWLKVPVRKEGPVALFFVGDPHLDADGCDWVQLRQDIAEMKRCKNGLAVNLGDQLDNWVGRLMEKYAGSDMSMSTGRKLVKWLFRESGVPWWLILRGNHDEWHFSGELFTEYARPIAQTAKWEAQLTLVFPNKREVRLWCAHDFPGNSIWHGLHGPLRASKMRDMAHIYACGDKHNWATYHYENADRDFTPLVVRARGYKSLEDDFAEHKLGKTLQKEGGTIMVVIDPHSKTEGGLCTPFTDLRKGNLFLNALIKEHKRCAS